MPIGSRSSLLLTLLLALSLIAAPVGGALAVAGMMGMGEQAPASDCPESAQAADDARAHSAGSDQLHPGAECCDPPCLAKCGHAMFATLATLPGVLVLPAMTPPSTPVPALSATYPEPPAHPPRSR